MDLRGCLGYPMEMQITSAGNERIKHAKRVRDGRVAELIFIEGWRLAEEAVRSGLTVEVCFTDEEEPDARGAELLRLLTQIGVPVLPTKTALLQSLAATVQSQGIILLARRPGRQEGTWLGLGSTLILGLDRIQDPGNLGTLLRTAEAAGVGGIVTLRGSADAFSPKVLRSAMGAAFRLPLLAEAGMEDLMQLWETGGYKMVAAAGDGEVDYCEYDWRQPTLLLLGNEGGGVAPELMQACDVRLHIPMQAGVESLNVAAAGAVMLFEAARQRR